MKEELGNPEEYQIRDAVTALARSHTAINAKPAPIPVLTALSLINDWIKKVEVWCRDPEPEYVRAADWFLDNDYHIIRAVRSLEEDLPISFFNRLPALENGKKTSTPRIFSIAKTMIEEIQPQLSLNEVCEFAAYYQEICPLTNAELWALPSMLRLASLENLIDAFSCIDQTLAPPFLKDNFNQPLVTRDPIDLIASAITNLIAVYSIKWPDFVDQVSPIEAVLKKDPSDVYSQMNFETRNRYRSSIEMLAERSELSETEVAEVAVKAASHVAPGSAQNHVGYWLIGNGRHTTEREIAYRASITQRLQNAVSPYTEAAYFTSLLIGFLLALIVPALYVFMTASTLWHWVAGMTLSILPASVLSVTVVNWIITKFTEPAVLPELDFKKKISSDYRTAVVIPVILKDQEEIPNIIEKLEVKWLANADPMLRFVVLSDPPDAAVEKLPSDSAMEQRLRTEIKRLNSRFTKNGGAPFVLLHRHRQYNHSEQCWMAWERKRGKLEQFNRLVLHGDETGFVVTEGNINELKKSRFAITLDVDTELPPGSAARLVGMLAHCLNTARFDADTGALISGYTIIQPRIEILPRLGSGTHFSHIYSGDTAIDIYSRAVSDIYQDLFSTGIYVGKGIYDIAAMDQALAGRVPENRILSHDLFEGIHGRVALASNIVLYEDFPETYKEYALRLNRWVRGDWQLLPWLRRKVPSASGEMLENKLSYLDRWKVIDNLRRSLVPPALLLFFIGAWMVLPGSALVWTLLVIAAPGSYLAFEVYSLATAGMRANFFSDASHRLAERSGRWFFSIVFLVNDTLISIDAIARTVWRLIVTKKQMLEWKSAAHTATSAAGLGIRAQMWRFMWPSSVFSALLILNLTIYDIHTLGAAAPILFLWLISPEIAVWSAQRRTFRAETIQEKDKRFLRQVARRTWHFFETFTGPEDNWLPPDNYQEHPEEITAHRTSPTNIGMYLVSALAARDFGFITGEDFLVRTRNTLDTLDRMKSHRGHILNWYDTHSLEPLEPQYVSTVDSGNLAIALIAIKQGVSEVDQMSVVNASCWNGLADTLDVLMAAFDEHPWPEVEKLQARKREIEELISTALKSPEDWCQIVDDLRARLLPAFEQIILSLLKETDDISHKVLDETHIWLERVDHHLRAMRRDLDHHYPWNETLKGAPSAVKQLADNTFSLLTPDLPASELIAMIDTVLGQIEQFSSDSVLQENGQVWLETIEDQLRSGKSRAESLLEEFKSVAERASQFAYAMDFSFLYNPEVRLFSIGYNLSSGRLDPSHYDLLATEARLASFFAMAKQDAPIEHWQFLSRPITRLSGKPSILSWNGSMFEYLMPPIFLPSNRDTLLGEGELTAVDHQRRYAKRRGVPWGISESAFGVTDSEGNYQYRAFGVPGLGIRRDLGKDLVIAPYASALALCMRPASSVQNLRTLKELGALSPYGYWDALDFTPERSIDKARFVPVKTYMAHHQGMTIAAILNVLKDDILVQRVMRDKPLQAISLLLQERVPWEESGEEARMSEAQMHHPDPSAPAIPAPWLPSATSLVPQIQLLGNGRMSSHISEAGAGGLSWQQIAITRWLPDPTCDRHGCWIYVHDSQTDDLWSVGRQPIGISGHESRTVFHQHMVELFRRDGDIATRMETTVAPFDDVEIKRMTITNEGNSGRTITISTYAEIVLAPPRDDERHTAFSKLFVQSTFLPDQNGLLFERRARRPEDAPPALLHMLLSQDPSITLVAYESDRHQFIDRNGNQKSPLGLRVGLSKTTGWTLDPVAVLQVQLELAPGETKQFSLLNIVGSSRGQIVQTAATLSNQAIDRAFRDAALDSARELSRFDIASSHLPSMQIIASLLLQPSPTLRTVVPLEGMTTFGQPDLWRFGLSGDLPILLLTIDDDVSSQLIEILIKAQRIWHKNGLRSDLVILRTGVAGYEEPLRERILSILRETHAEGFLGRNGGVHLVSIDQMDGPTRNGFEAAAHVVLSGDVSTLEDQLDRILEQKAVSENFESTFPAMPRSLEPHKIRRELAFENGYGGFDADKGEFVIRLEPGQNTPAPWCNVMANDQFGTIVSEAGLGFTWAINSGENRLTPWSNDPVENTPGEIVYLRDELTSEKWTVTPAPLGHSKTCEISHGKGYTRWERHSHDLEQELLAFVPADDPVKIVRLRLKNHSDIERRITATYYAEWLLGALGSISKPQTKVRFDPAACAIIARNDWNTEFEGRAAFLTASLKPHSMTGDRHDFLGRERDVSSPQGLDLWDLGENFTLGADPCAAYQVHLDIPAGETTEVIFILGQAANETAVQGLAEKWRTPENLQSALNELDDFWTSQLGAVQVETPDSSFDLMVNQWLPYQNLSCRIQARAAFYQAGGAYGFRDQLQDMLPLLHSDPARVRRHILFAAHSQFQEGDALHWWHPPAGRGVRTRCSDDYLWLVYVTARYVEATGDASILDVEVPFLKAPALRQDEGDRYARFDVGEIGRLFDHCARALDRAMVTGSHGLPLMGSGDWNDGMDRVGDEGRGESVWLAWFLISIIDAFSPISKKYGYEDSTKRWKQHASALSKAIHREAWDGAWYIRAFDDNGEPWGSKVNDECQIDSIAQSWSILSGEPPTKRSITALNSAWARLVETDDRLVKLLDPPFDKTLRDPGYIQAYPPGVRENGGQYTHAATWLGLAFARLGDGDKAKAVFDIINPVNRTRSKDQTDYYRREPYVLPGDVSGGDQAGRGGWSWYTGAAGWTLQLAINGIMGIRLKNGSIQLDPSLPTEWKKASATLQNKRGKVKIVILNPEGHGSHVVSMIVDGKPTKAKSVHFPGAGKTKHVVINLGI